MTDPENPKSRVGISLHTHEKKMTLAKPKMDWVLRPGVRTRPIGLKKRRNSICLCGSGLKYKMCCLPKHREAASSIGEWQ